MSLQKLSAGDGYTYLTRQVAAADDTNRGYGSLRSYYEQKGESPGVWLGRGLDSLDGSVPEFRVSGVVTEAQMTALFGEGRHPNADVIERQLQRAGVRGCALDGATKLGQEYRTYDANPFREQLAARYRDHKREPRPSVRRSDRGRDSGTDPLSWRRKCSRNGTAASLRTGANSRGSWRGHPGPRRSRWPATTSPSAR